MKILAVDSSAKACSAAIVEDDKIIGSFFINTSLTHSQTLVPMVENLLSCTSLSLSDIDRLAVSAGPGSFTGVRIGVSAIKGMAMPLGLPCAGVSTLAAMAHNLSGCDCVACAVMDARCNQVYNALFGISGGKIERLCDDRALAISDLCEELRSISGEIILVGDGAELCYNSLKEELPSLSIAPEHIRYQNAFGVALEAQSCETVTAAELLPSYLRLPQAERELKKKMESKK